jgi:diaminopimelate decarboxylase
MRSNILACFADDIDGPVRPQVLPIIHPVIQDALKQKDLLFSLIGGIGSPLNVIFPQNIGENIAAFEATYKKHHLRGRIYYTSKPCKSRALWRQASLRKVGIDVSSVNSLQAVMGCGFTPNRIEATGPKNTAYLVTALQLNVTINIDNAEELEQIIQLHESLGLTHKTRIFIRLCDFKSTRISFTPQDNTFGIATKDIPPLLDKIAKYKDRLDFLGFSFHFSSTNTEQRVVAIENQLELTFLAKQKGLNPKGINIGGAFQINYVATQQEWDCYVSDLKLSVLDQLPSQTWNKGGLGYRNENGTLNGSPLFAPHYYPKVKGEELDELLCRRLPGFSNSTIASIIGDSLLELYIEPGKAMVDQCGITLGRVNHVKASTWGEVLVNLDVNQTNLNAVQNKNLSQPVILYKDPSRNAINENGLFYTGNLCTSFDILQYNKQFPELVPQKDDVVVFINTAPYAMDFAESETLMQDTAKKVALWTENGQWHWTLDERYLPVGSNA